MTNINWSDILQSLKRTRARRDTPASADGLLSRAIGYVQQAARVTEYPSRPPGGGGGGGDRGVNMLRLYDVPSYPFMVRFMSSAAVLEDAVPIAWDALDRPTAFLNQAMVDPKLVNEADQIDVVDLDKCPLEPGFNRMGLDITRGDGSTETVMPEEGIAHFAAGLSIEVSKRIWRDGISEVEIIVRADLDGYYRQIEVMSFGAQVYSPDTKVSGLFFDFADQPFVWLRGQTTIRRFLIGDGITPEDKRRFSNFLYYGTLTGRASYEYGGYGPTDASLPRCDESGAGWDLQLSRHQDGLEKADRYHDHFIFGDHHPEFIHDNGCGPWNPSGATGGGGTGGDGIHPYSGWTMTPGEIAAAWWSTRGMMERMMMEVHTGGVSISKPEWYQPYENDLAKYRKHDHAHAIRAMVSPLAVAWCAGSPAGLTWFRRLPDYYGEPDGFPSEFDGEGHKYANRNIGWHSTVWATALSVTNPAAGERVTLRNVCEDFANIMLKVAMPSGITHRAASQTDGGPFTAFLNPDMIALGKIPHGVTLARTFMVAIVIHGAYALEVAAFGDGRMWPLVVHAADSAFFHSVPPRAHSIVGGLQIGQAYPTTSFSVTDDYHGMWEGQWALCEAWRMTGDAKYITQAAAFMGHNSLDALPYLEFQRTGSNRAWWDRNIEVIAEVQKLENSHV